MMKKLPRFLLTLTPALALGYGVALSDAIGLGTVKIKKFKNVKFRQVSGSIAFIVTAWLLYTSFGVVRARKESIDYNLSLFKWGYFDVLKDRPHKPVYNTGGWWDNKLSFYFLPDMRYADMPWRRSDMLRDIKEVKNPSELAGSYVILDRRHFSGNNDLRIRHSYDEFGGYVKVPPDEWRLLGRSRGAEIYEVPEGWTYVEPDGKELVYKALLHSVEIEDVMLFLNCLTPEFVNNMTQQIFSTLFLILKNKNDPRRNELLTEHLEYRKHDGMWKIHFTCNL